MELDILRVFSFIENRIDNNEEVTVKDCCEYFNYSYHYFSRLFKKMAGIPPSSYITALKMERTLSLLLDPDMNVSEVYNRVQYQSPSSFTRSFKKYMGICPSEYKQKAFKFSEYMGNVIETKEKFEIELLSKHLLNNSFNNGNNLSIEIKVKEEINVALIVVGIYLEPIALGNPIRGKALFNSNKCVFENIPKGEYHIFASIIEEDTEKIDYFFPKKLLKACNKKPLDFPKEDSLILEARYERKNDLPVVINMPKLLLDELDNKKLKMII